MQKCSCYNNPINFCDFSGLAPGQHYATQRRAAIEALGEINPISVSEGVEYGVVVTENKDGTFEYTKPFTQNDPNQVKVPVIITLTKILPTQNRDRSVAVVHTHGKDEPGDEDRFSDEDIDFAYKVGVDLYLGTPQGSLWYRDYNTRGISKFPHTIPINSDCP